MLIYFKKLLNSYLTPRFLFRMIISNNDYDSFLFSTINFASFSYKVKKRLSKLFFFWPSIIDVDSWIEGDFGKYRDPSHFKDLRPGIDILLLDKVLEHISDYNAPVLDLGCNSGRHLEYLHINGLRNLTGVDIMKNALLYLQERCPKVYYDSKIYHDFFQRFLFKTGNNQFEIVYTVGATIELVHPSFDIVREMCRVASSYVIILVQENNQSYPRFYVSEFKKHGFILDFSIRPIKQADCSVSLLVFKNKIVKP
jgi:SAM-dependent methyltransferase